MYEQGAVSLNQHSGTWKIRCQIFPYNSPRAILWMKNESDPTEMPLSCQNQNHLKKVLFLTVSNKCQTVFHFLCSSFFFPLPQQFEEGHLHVATVNITTSMQSRYLNISFVQASQLQHSVTSQAENLYFQFNLKHTDYEIESYVYCFTTHSQRSKCVFNSLPQPSELENKNYHYDLFA